ncbi:MAG: rRNA methyltransferase [Bacteroidetes bacterium GWF2_40_14]|nr:MAG: rRNA methyltransferase [Bacteroidetes bacterium GWF2_40_14]
MDSLSSTKNPKIKELIELQEKSRERREKGLFIVEGIRELEACIRNGYEIESLFFFSDEYPQELASNITCNHLYSVTSNVYSKIAYRGGTEGVTAIVREKKLKLNDIKLSENPLVIVLESVEKPGNLGAILRTADAAKADAVIICDPLTDLFNPNVIRSSLGGIFTNQVCSCTSDECYVWLKSNGLKILTAELQAAGWYHKTDMTSPTALVMGSESDGLKPFWRERADARIKIPMNGTIDSLNVSVSTAILCFEALRQRDFKY